MWLRFLLISSFVVLCHYTLTAQPVPNYRAVFSSGGPFYTRCDNEEQVPVNSHVVIVWDEGHDGIGGSDQIPFTDGGYPEGMFANFYDFYSENSGDFWSPVFEARYMYWNSEPFYLILEHVDSVIIRWTSPIFMLHPTGPGDEPQSVSLPAHAWACDTVDEAIECEAHPSLIHFAMHEAERPPVCVWTCQGGRTSIIVWHDEDSLDATRFPILELETGCGDSAAAGFDYNPHAWEYWNGVDWWVLDAIHGRANGWFTVTMLDSAPCGEVSEFNARRNGSAVDLSWSTSRETSIAYFEVSSYHATFPNWYRHLGNFTSNDEPSEYTFVDTDPQPQSYIYYCITMVDLDSVRWAARRAYVPVPMNTDEQPSVVSIPSLSAFPNPFNASTQVEFDLPASGEVTLSIFDITGRLVTTLMNELLPPGHHAVTFDGRDLASGLYFARLQSGENFSTHKMVLLK